jgi:ADP-heptose:LPS heptosyltransferase
MSGHSRVGADRGAAHPASHPAVGDARPAAARGSRPVRDAGGPPARRHAPATHAAATRRPRVLVLRALGLGDLLAGVPALRALRRHFAGYDLVLAAPEGLRAAVAATEAVTDLLPATAPGRAVPSLAHWPGRPPEVAVDLHGNGPESHRALAELQPERLLSFAGAAASGRPAPRWRADEHERLRWCRFLTAYGIAADPADLRLRRPDTPSPRPGAVVVHPGANAPARQWPAKRYAEVIRTLLAEGHRVVVSGGPGDGEQVGDVVRLAGLGPREVLFGLPFDAFSALVAHAAVFLSADTGPAHLAVAHGTPSVTLFGPVAPSLWGPPPQDPRHTALWEGGPPGDPNGPVADPRLLALHPAEAAGAVLALAGSAPHRSEVRSAG